MNKLVLALTVIAFSVLLSCSKGNKDPKESSATENTLAATQLKAIEDSCSKAWNMMLSSDDQKIKDIQRLLQEISYIPSHNEQELKRLSEQAKELVKLRYTQDNLSSDKIDAYDQATDALLQAVFELKRNTKGVEQYTLTEELEKSIREADGSLVNYRVLYDVWVKKYNAELAKIPTAELKQKTTFEIQE